MEQKKYLKWYNKLGYGSGDCAACLTYALVTQFVMIYLTDSVGLASGIVGTLIMISKIFDGITDVTFGHLIDKTHTKMGRARPWMFFAQFGVSFFVVALFSIPNGLGGVSKYVWFFVTYTMMNSIFYTANNIAYASLTSLITKNVNERVQVGVVRFCFSLGTNIFVAYTGVSLSSKIGWSRVALVFTIFAIIINTISVFSVRELPDEELYDREENLDDIERPGVIESVKLCFTNRYYVSLFLSYLLMYIQQGFSGISIYYFTYVAKNTSQYSSYTSISYFPMLVALLFTPALVKKFGMYKTNLVGYGLGIASRVVFVIAGYTGNFPLLIAATVAASLVTGPLIGDQNALIAESSEYTYRVSGKRVDGMMFSCSSMGNKLGTGIGTAVYGILLQASGYVAELEQQSAGTINMINFCFLLVPLIMTVLLFIDLMFLNVEKANRDWDAAHEAAH